MGAMKELQMDMETKEEVLTMDLIVIEQLPVITETLRTHAAEIDEKLSIVDNLVCTEESVKEVKKVRAGFNKESAAAHELFRSVKSQVLMRWNEVEQTYNECIRDKYKAADIVLKNKIGEVESELKARKTETVKAFFNEYAQSHSVEEYADFDKQMAAVRMSDTETTLKRIVKERIDSLVSGLRAIEAQPEEHRAEILSVFKKTLKATEAITIVAERHKAIEQQKQAQAARAEQKAREAESVAKVEAVVAPTLAPPTVAAPVDDDPVCVVSFKVTGKRSKLRLLKAFLIEGCYQYE